MKKTLTVVLLLATLTVSAAEVGNLTSFIAATPAKAAEVNDNFNKLKTAVDENYTRLTTAEAAATASNSKLTALETQANSTASAVSGLSSFKENLIDNSCSEGSALRSINADGSTLCQTITPAGLQRWSAHDFHQEDERSLSNCALDRDPMLAVYGSNTICTVYAPVHIPNSMRVSSIECVAYDTLTGGAGQGTVRVKLQRREYSTGTLYDVFDTGASASDSGTQLLTDTTALSGSSIIDNLNNVYRLSVQFAGITGNSLLTSNTGSVKLALSTCGVDFYPQ